jgi:hypothetical protein
MDMSKTHPYYFGNYQFLGENGASITPYCTYVSESPYYPLHFPLFTLHKLLFFEKYLDMKIVPDMGVFSGRDFKLEREKTLGEIVNFQLWGQAGIPQFQKFLCSEIIS